MTVSLSENKPDMITLYESTEGVQLGVEVAEGCSGITYLRTEWQTGLSWKHWQVSDSDDKVIDIPRDMI